MLFECGWFCVCLSVWAVLQLTIMGVMFKIEATNMIAAAAAEEFEDVADFIAKTKENYKKCSLNCFIAAGVYGVILLSSFLCIAKAKKDEKKRQLAMLDDDFSCTVEETELTEKQKKKIK